MRMLTMTLAILCAMTVSAQRIELINGSFEGEPRDAVVPQGWMPCKEGTTPDILPGFWGVYDEPSDGNTYVGLISRENDTWESIGQRLSNPMLKGTCYEILLDLSHSDTYSGYNGALRLRIYGGSSKCSQEHLIYESPIIKHTSWKTYSFKFTPPEDMRYIVFEAYHPEHPVNYKGNILIDNVREIRACDRT